MISRRAFLKFGAAFAVALGAAPLKALASRAEPKLLPVDYRFESHPGSNIDLDVTNFDGPGFLQSISQQPEIHHFLTIRGIPSPADKMFLKMPKHIGTVNETAFLKAGPGCLLFSQYDGYARHNAVEYAADRSVVVDLEMKFIERGDSWNKVNGYAVVSKEDGSTLYRESDFNDMLRELRRVG